MKKILAVFIAAVLLLLMISCRTGGDTDISVDGSSSSTETVSDTPVQTGEESRESTPAEDSKADDSEPASTDPESGISAETDVQAPVEGEDDFVYKYAVIIGVDGAGAFFKNADTPNLDKIFKNGSVTYKATASTPSISAECWGAMLHGVEPEWHRLTNSIVESTAYAPDSKFPSVFRLIRENDPDCTLASFCTWNPINVGIIEDGLGVHKETAASDLQLSKNICRYLKNNSPKLLFVQFDNVDGAGHSSGYGSAAHLNQITTTDQLIADIYEMYESKGILEDTLFIVTADHGGAGTSHGGSTATEMDILFAAVGKTVQQNAAAVDMQIRDTASVIAHALGYEQPEYWTSIVPSGVFEGVEAGERKVLDSMYDVEHRTHASTPTPTADGGNYLTDYISKNVVTYLNFDGNTTPALGSYETSESGKLYFVDGYFGEAVKLDDGYVTLKEYSPGVSSFTIAMWFKTGGVGSDPCLVSNSDWSYGMNPGFNLSLRQTDVKFNYGNTASRIDFEYPLPFDFKNGWVHIILSVDREMGTVSFSYDFGEWIVSKIPASMANSSFGSSLSFNIGQDGTGKYQSLGAVIDELLIWDGAMTQDDVTALAEYYGIKK